MSFGENIRRMREELHMTQKELADAVGVTSQYITQIERGTKVLSVTLGLDIAYALKCELNDIVYGKGA